VYIQIGYSGANGAALSVVNGIMDETHIEV
jgi:hypothetical protein